MHGCASGSLLVVNAELDSMGGAVDGRVGISSVPSPQQSSDLEKTQAELRQTFTAAEKFRRELEFLQKGGDPLDLKPGNAATVSFQSTSLTDHHPEQFVTSEAKGSFAVTASPHGDSVESSGRLGVPSGCEPNSADNLMLFDGDSKCHEIEKRPLNLRTNNNTQSKHSQSDSKEPGDSAILELPKKSYKRRFRSRPNRDGVRSSSTDAAPSRGGHSFLPFRHASRDSKPKSPNASMALKNSNCHLDELGGAAVESTLGPAHGPYSAVSDAVTSENTQENHNDQPIKSVEPEALGGAEQAHLAGPQRSSHGDPQIVENSTFPGPTNAFRDMEEIKSIPCDNNSGAAPPMKILDSESSCNQTGQCFDGYNGNRLPTNLASKEVPDMESNHLVTEKDDKILDIDKANKDGSIIKEGECLKGSESALQNELQNPVSSTKGVDSDGCTVSRTERKPGIVLGPSSSSQDGNPCSGRTQGLNDTTSQNNLKQATKEHEDSILEEARIIEAKRKRIAQLSVRTLPLERRPKSHWNFVLEEMSWLANDFAQERLWKVTAAAQICRRVAFSSRARLQLQSSLRKQKEVAHTLAEAVMEFWQMIQVKCKELKSHCATKDGTTGIQGYAMRFLEYNSSDAQYNTAQAPLIPDSISDLGVLDISWEDNLTEENLFYTVPPGAIEAYRKSIESHLLQCERTGSSMQEEVDTSGYGGVADITFEEEEGETSTYYLSGVFEGSKSSKTPQKRRKNFKSYSAKSYEMGGDLPFIQPVERSIGTQPSVVSGKRPASSLNVSIPTKRVRTASRQRVISPFNAGTSGGIQAPNRADASSGDTNSFQDEQSTLHGGSQMLNNMEAESVGDYEKQLQFDSVEVSNRPKKKKKAKHPGSTFEHRWQLDSNFQNDQKDHSRRRQDTHQFDSNGSSVASQMSNMSNPNKFMKLLVRDRGRKAKSLKIPVGQPGSGSPWSLFEDQALVVLVHDMGPNWELISDAINSTLQFKSVFRKSKECKERHKILMDRGTGDGADSAEDSGSSQPYPSTLPGIPEGSARQLFQRLQGPMEEDTLKSHFEKIIMIGQKQHYKRTQNDNHDPRQLQQPHNSHAFSLSQVCPNNLSGGSVLTPLELCEAVASSPDVLPVGYQGGPHSGGLPVLNHGTVAPMLPGSGSTSSASGSSNPVHGSNLPSASAPLNPSAREGRYGIPRMGSLSLDDQQRMQQYNQMLSARNMQQSGLPPGSHSVADRGVRMLPSGSGMGVMCGINRPVKMARPGYQGLASPSMHSGSVPGPSPGQGSSMLRPRDPKHMTRPNQNTDHQRMVPPDLQMPQAAQGGTPQVAPPFASRISPAFPNPLHHPPQKSPYFQGPPNFGMRFVKERQLQQQRLLQQQQQFPTTEAQITVSPPENSAHIPSQSSSPRRNPSGNGNGNQLLKQQQRQLAAKVIKGARGTMMVRQNVPTEPSLNGFSGGLSPVVETGSKQSVQKLFPGQTGQTQAGSSKQAPQQKTSHLLDNNNNNISNQKMLNSRKDATSNETEVGSRKTSEPLVPDGAQQTGTGCELSGPAVNQVAGGQDVGVHWRRQPPS